MKAALRDLLEQLVGFPLDPEDADTLQLQLLAARILLKHAHRRPANEKGSPEALALGRKGGRARADALSAERRSQIATIAARKRWGNDP